MKNFTLKLRINFRKLRKNYFGYYLKTDKDISKIPTDSDSAEQQLNDSKNYKNPLKKIKKSCVYSTKTLKCFKT